MDTIELWNGSTKALIDPVGGWLTNLSDDYGDILYPQRKLKNENGKKKLRGGCHVCLPNFGPGGNSGQSQHGFGREMIWEVQEQGSSSCQLRLKEGGAGYETLESRLRYTVNESTITMMLELRNNGEKDLRVAPAFHPYLALDRGEGQVTLNDNHYDVQDLASTEFFEGDGKMTLQLQKRTLTLESENLSTWALWSDQLGDYVCCEPTFDGYAFLHNSSENELLQPGKSAQFSMTISW